MKGTRRSPFWSAPATFMEETGQPFEVALAVTRAGNLFTTHTAVAAGFDRFAPALIEQYLGGYAEQKLGITLHDLLALGRQNPNDSSETFNMAYLAIRGSGAVNGVSRLHGKVSRHLFLAAVSALAGGRSPGRTRDQRSPHAHLGLGAGRRSLDGSLRKGPLAGDDGKSRSRTFAASPTPGFGNFARPPARLLWNTLANDCPGNWPPPAPRAEAVEGAKHLFDPNALTLGFARRFATYKRPNLLLHDPERLLRLLTNPQRPVQLILAGKAHPADQAGQALIQEWMHFIRRPEARPHVIFLSDYDMLLTEQLVQGVDVWINTPRRPWEACGTSGMKVLVNGGINLSELDGWWAEAYTPEVGWALGDGQEHGDDPAWDAAEAEALYDLLEQEVIPEFYARDANGIPAAWVKRMRESMARLTPAVLRRPRGAENTPSTITFRPRLPTVSASRTKAPWAGKWWSGGTPSIGTGIRCALEACESKPTQIRTCLKSNIFLNDLDPNAVRIELYADGTERRRCRACGDEVRAAAGWRLRLSRKRTCYTCCDRLHGASDTAAPWGFRSRWNRLTFCGNDDGNASRAAGRRQSGGYRLKRATEGCILSFGIMSHASIEPATDKPEQITITIRNPDTNASAIASSTATLTAGLRTAGTGKPASLISFD